MKTITKFIYATFAVVIVTIGAVTANGAPGDLFGSISGRANPSASPQGSINEYSSIGFLSSFISPLTNPRGMAFDSAGNLFVATTSNDTSVQATILKFTPDGTVTPFGTLASNLFASGVAIDHSDNVFVACYDNDNGVDAHIIKFTPNGTETTFASLPGQLFGLAFDSAGNLFAVSGAFQTELAIYKFTPDGTGSIFVGPSAFPSGAPIGLAFDRFGNLFVSTESLGMNPDAILKFTPDGTESTFATGLITPRGLAFDRAGNLFVAQIIAFNTLDGNILKFTPDGVGSVFASNLWVPEYLAFQLRPTPRPRPSPHPRPISPP